MLPPGRKLCCARPDEKTLRALCDGRNVRRRRRRRRLSVCVSVRLPQPCKLMEAAPDPTHRRQALRCDPNTQAQFVLAG